MSVIEITSSAQLKDLIEGLKDDVVHAHFHYNLLLRLADEFAIDPRIYNESPAFWGTIATSLCDAVLMRMTRAYDQQRQSLSLVNWLDTIRANLNLFELGAREARVDGSPIVDSLVDSPHLPDRRQLDRDRESVSSRDPLVKKLIQLRNNGAAHVSARSVAAGVDPFQQHALSSTEYPQLLQHAKSILDRYSVLFRVSTYSTTIVGADDYLFVVRAVSARLDASR